MATAFKELYPEPRNLVVASHLMSDDLLVGAERPRATYMHPTGLPGDLRIETDKPELRPEVKAVLAQLTKLSELEAGWDSYSAVPVDKAAIRPALDVALYAVQRCQAPRITAGSDGAIILIWEEGGRELEVEVAPTTNAATVFLVDTDGQEYEPEAPVSLAEAKAFIDRYCRS